MSRCADSGQLASAWPVTGLPGSLPAHPGGQHHHHHNHPHHQHHASAAVVNANQRHLLLMGFFRWLTNQWNEIFISKNNLAC